MSSSSITLPTLLDNLGKIASLQLAEKWDNVGLLIESLSSASTPIDSMLLTIDLTEPVVEEAIQKKVQFILAYHPPIFDALKQVTTKTTKQRIVIKCLSNGISVYSPHTAFDSVRNGINDWLAEGLGDGTREPIKPIVVDGMKTDEGIGRIVTLAEPAPLEEVVQRIKSHLGLERLRLARGEDSSGTVKTIAICAGSGGSVLKGVRADLYFTGEMSHHDVLSAVASGTSVVLCEHTNTERGFLKKLKTRLETEVFPAIDGASGVAVHLSEIDSDPLKIV